MAVPRSRALAGVVSVRADRKAKPLAARVTADTDEGHATFDIDLAPGKSEQNWDTKLVGQRNGLTLELRFVWRHDQDHGSAQLTWRLSRATGPAAERAQAITLIVALHGEGTLSVADREDDQCAISQPTSRRQVPAGLRALRDVYQDLADIQTFAGKTFGRPPDEFSAEDANNLAYLADLLRRGKVDASVTSATMIMTADGLAGLRQSGNEIQVRENLIARFFDREIHVAERVVHLPWMQVSHATGLQDGWEVELVPVGGNDAPATIEYLPPDPPPNASQATRRSS